MGGDCFGAVAQGALLRYIFFTQCFVPFCCPRAYQLAHLVRHIEEPIIVVCCEDHTPKDLVSNMDLLEKKNVNIMRYKRHCLSRLLDYAKYKLSPELLYAPDAYKNWAMQTARSFIESFQPQAGDRLITFGQPMSDHLAGLLIKKEFPELPWIAHFSDPWSDNPYRLQTKDLLKVNLKMETDVLKACDQIIYTTRQTLDLVMAKYDDSFSRKARVLPHAYDPSLFTDSPSQSTGKKIIRHIGNFYGSRNPGPLFRALNSLKEKNEPLINEFIFELIGSIPKEVRNGVMSNRLDGLVKIKEPVPYLQSLQLMASSDGLIIIDAPAENSVFLPSKLVEYLGAQRPVFGVTPPGASRDLINDMGGWTANPEKEAEIEETLKTFLKLLSESSEHPWGNKEMCKRYQAKKISQDFKKMVGETS